MGRKARFKKSKQLVVTRPTLVETKAREFLRRFFTFHTTGTTPWSATPVTTLESTQDFFRSQMQSMLHTVDGRLQLIAAAKAGYAEPLAILRAVLKEYKSRGLLNATPLTIELHEYDLWLTANGGEPPLQRDTGKWDHYTRDWVVGWAVIGLLAYFPSLRPTNQSARKHSASSLTSEVLAEFQLAMTSDNVWKIWKRLRNALTPTNREGYEILFGRFI
jgi:hypothetical protein